MKDDYYKILDIPKTASQAEIQKAYRKHARKLHPDVNQSDVGAKKKFQKLQEAYDVLNDPEKRRIYDQFGVSPDQMGTGGGQGPFQWSFGSGGTQGPFTGFRSSSQGNTGTFDINDFMKMFGGGAGMADGQDVHFGGMPRPTRGTDLERTLRVPFTVSILGGTVEMSLRRGNKTEKISVQIPAGIEDGKKIRLAAQGNPGVGGGKPGNLLVTVQVDEHPFFYRQAANLYVRVPISLKEAVFGAKIDVPTPKESVCVTIPAGSSTGTKLRLRGCGLRKSAIPAEVGDLFVELSVVLPKKWSEADLKRLEALQIDTPEKLRHDLQF